jgi:hypothetical protein
MAGSGYKSWDAGDVLAANEVNGYLMDQAVMYFASAATRTSGIPGPAAGMHTYRADGTVVEVYNGLTWVSANSVGGTVVGSQVTGNITNATINATNVTNTLTSSASTSYSVVTADQGTVLRFTAAGTVTATVGTATALTAGQRVDIIADGAAGVKISAGSGVTFAGAGTVSSNFLLEQYSAATIISVGSNAYRIIGNVLAI